MARETPSQTAGPYLHIGLMPNAAGIDGVYRHDVGSVMVSNPDIVLTGCIYDGAGAPVTDAVIEAWQADIGAFGRSASDPDTGEFRFETCRSDDAFLTLWIIARGINLGLYTRAYWPGDLPALPGLDEARARTLMMQDKGRGAYRFDMHLQGPHETVFLDG